MPRKQPYRRPRDWLSTEKDPDGKDPQRQFGKHAAPDWLPAKPGIETATLEAAKAQHDLARRIRRFRDDQGKTNEDIAKAIGVDARTVDRILNGSIHATVAQLHAIAAALQLRMQTSIGIPRPPGNTGTSVRPTP